MSDTPNGENGDEKPAEEREKKPLKPFDLKRVLSLDAVCLEKDRTTVYVLTRVLLSVRPVMLELHSASRKIITSSLDGISSGTSGLLYMAPKRVRKTVYVNVYEGQSGYSATVHRTETIAKNNVGPTTVAVANAIEVEEEEQEE